MIRWCRKLKDSEVYPSNPIHTMPCRDYAAISLPIAQKKNHPAGWIDSAKDIKAAYLRPVIPLSLDKAR
jgi:hypothetical protein